jgi:uncharacterized protein YhaN
MRLKRLDLIRCGNFTGRSIDFGEKPQGLPDLHIVYGPNEAGNPRHHQATRSCGLVL